MFTYSKDITKYFFNLIERNISLQEFLTWAKSSEDLIEEIGIDSYADLLSVEFCMLYAIQDLEKMIYEFYKNSKIGMNYEKVLWLLESMIDGSYDIVTGCAVLARMRSFEKGYDFIPIIFVGYDSVIEDLVWHYKDNVDKSEAERLINLYKIEIINEAKELCDMINKNPKLCME